MSRCTSHVRSGGHRNLFSARCSTALLWVLLGWCVYVLASGGMLLRHNSAYRAEDEACDGFGINADITESLQDLLGMRVIRASRFSVFYGPPGQSLAPDPQSGHRSHWMPSFSYNVLFLKVWSVSGAGLLESPCITLTIMI